MEIVVDTNIIAAAIVKDGMTRKLLFHSIFDLYSPDSLLIELERNKAVFLVKSGLDPDSYGLAVQALLSSITQVPLDVYLPFKEEAEKISPDRKDWPFFAVALQRNCAIWSNEKRLKNQNKVEVYNTKDLLDLLEAR